MTLALTVGAVIGAGSRTAFADSAGPTDYLASVESIDPPTPTIVARILGGDSLFELAVDAGVEVTVIGYQGEPYLRILADGAVEENRYSPTVYVNTDRFGSGMPPPEATADAEPLWRRVGGDGTIAWHDHRAHYMQAARPAGKERGDRVSEGVIPLVVDGVRVDVTVVSVWQASPSRVPVLAGVVAALVLGAAAAWSWRRVRKVEVAAAVAVAGGVAGAMVGWWQYQSLPAAIGTRWTWWALPVVAVVAAVAAAAVRGRQALVALALLALAGTQLVIWGWMRRQGMWRALISTDAPFWLDRAVTAAAIVLGIVLAVGGVAAMFASAFASRPPLVAGRPHGAREP